MRILLLLSLFTAPALGQSFSLSLDPTQSTSHLDGVTQVALAGDWRGVYDPLVNPGGTKTLLGLFGGTPSDNDRVPLSMDFEVSPLLDGQPTGVLDITLQGPVVTVDGLAIDLLGTQTGTLDMNLGVLFDTFRTYDPDSLYIGGFPLNIPLGSADLTLATLTQTAPGVGVLGSNPAGQQTIDVLIPVDLMLETGSAGAVTPIGPIPLLVPLSGTVIQVGGGLQLIADFSLPYSTVTNDPFAGAVFADNPIDLPTILPAGGIANLLLDFLISSITANGLLQLTLVADGSAACGVQNYCSSVPNSSGLGAALSSSGTPSIAAADLGFVVGDLPANQFGMFIMSSNEASIPNVGGPGTLCVGNPFVRFSANVQHSGAAGQVSFAPNWLALPGGTIIQPGDVWHFQYWTRDVAPAGGSANFSGGLRVTFCP
jgi:hypothetical protein